MSDVIQTLIPLAMEALRINGNPANDEERETLSSFVCSATKGLPEILSMIGGVVGHALATAQRERDDARVSLVSSRAAADGLRAAHVDIVSACKRQIAANDALTTERDALRGEVERLRGAHLHALARITIDSLTDSERTLLHNAWRKEPK